MTAKAGIHVLPRERKGVDARALASKATSFFERLCPGHDDSNYPTGVTLTATSSFWPPEANTTPSIGATSE